MPKRAKSVCPEPACNRLTSGGRCEQHKRQRWGNRPSRHARGYGSEWDKMRALVLTQEPFCACGCGRESDTVDHIVPKHKGGTNDRRNLQAMHHSCHGEKTAREGHAARMKR